MVERCQFPDAGSSDGGHIHCGRQSAETAVGADVRRGLFPAYVLLTSRKGQHESSFTFAVFAQPHKSARHAANELHLAREHTQARPAERLRDAEALAFAARNVSALAAGILEQAISEGFRETNDEQSALVMNGLSHRLEVLDAPKEIGRLHRDCSKIIEIAEKRKVGSAVLQVGKFHKLVTGGGEVGADHLSVQRMN